MKSTLFALALASVVGATPWIDFGHPASIPLTKTHLTGLDADGDTAYMCERGRLFKLVYDGSIRIIDSIPAPTGRQWDRSKYVALGDGLGVLSVAYSLAPANANNDSTFWLVDWQQAPGLSRYQGVSGTGPVHISNRTIQGIRLTPNAAAIARSEGLFLITAARSQIPGNGARMAISRPKAVPVDPYWNTISIDTSGLVAKTTQNDGTQVWRVPAAANLLAAFNAIALVDSLVKTPGMTPFQIRASNMLSLDADHWLEVYPVMPQGVFHSRLGSGAWSTDTLYLPMLATDEKQRFGQIVPVRGSAIGLLSFDGDSTGAVLQWDGVHRPMLMQTMPAPGSQGTLIGGNAFWQANYQQLRAYPILAANPNTPTSTLVASHRAVSWAVPGGLRVEGIPGTPVEWLDASGQQLGRTVIGPSGRAKIDLAHGGMILIRQGNSTRSLFVGR